MATGRKSHTGTAGTAFALAANAGVTANAIHTVKIIGTHIIGRTFGALSLFGETGRATAIEAAGTFAILAATRAATFAIGGAGKIIGTGYLIKHSAAAAAAALAGELTGSRIANIIARGFMATGAINTVVAVAVAVVTAALAVDRCTGTCRVTFIKAAAKIILGIGNLCTGAFIGAVAGFTGATG